MKSNGLFLESNGRQLPAFGELLRVQAQAIPDQVFMSIDGENLTYLEVCQQAEELARSMVAAGVGRQDRVAALMPNCIDFVIVFFAVQLVGAIVVPINARFKSHELQHVLGHSDIKLLFTTDRIDEHVNFLELIREAVPALSECNGGERLHLQSAPNLQHIIVFGESAGSAAVTLADFLAMHDQIEVDAADLSPRVSVDDISLMLYTSGTTAAPKGCQLTHRSLYHSWLRGYADAVALAEGESIWAPLPCFHVGGIGPMTAAVARGATIISSIHYDPASALADIRRHRPQHLYPGFFTLLLPLLRVPGYQAVDLDSVRTAIMVAPYETQKQIQALIPKRICVMQIFAMTEASGYVTLTRPTAPEEHRLNSSGLPLPEVEVRVVDADTAAVLPPAHEGEIQFRGPVAFQSYYADEDATRNTILEGGWVSTGDHGRMDEDGTVHFLGRIKDMLKVGGENVAAAEIEAYLGTHPAVKLAQVVSKPDMNYGEVPVAFIELLPNHQVSEEELITFCDGRMARFKIPREVIFVTEWPMSTTKIQKFKLREQVRARLQSAQEPSDSPRQAALKEKAR